MQILLLGLVFFEKVKHRCTQQSLTDRPCLVDVTELDADVDVDRPDVSSSRVRRDHVLKQRLSTLD